jgi:hypothetical protein
MRLSRVRDRNELVEHVRVSEMPVRRFASDEASS